MRQWHAAGNRRQGRSRRDDQEGDSPDAEAVPCAVGFALRALFGNELLIEIRSSSL